MPRSVISKSLVMLLPLMAACAVFAEETGMPMTQPGAFLPPILAYGENPKVVLPPKPALRPRKAEPSDTNSYCVRTCDGRYFPASSITRERRAEACKDLCPASQTAVFYGSSIDEASSNEGKPYSALPNAFRYRRELVAGCTCNGKDMIGLAEVKIEEDKTLRRGDMVAGKDGLEVVRNISPRHLELSVPARRPATLVGNATSRRDARM
jgi:Protein of unknown function (DUF2865)